jgi:hypothetical protein
MADGSRYAFLKLKGAEQYLYPGARRAISTFSNILEIEEWLNQHQEDIECAVWR